MAERKWDFESFLTKYLYDPEFGALVEKDLVGALSSMGIDITPEVKAAAESVVKNKEELMKSLKDVKNLADVVNGTSSVGWF